MISLSRTVRPLALWLISLVCLLACSRTEPRIRYGMLRLVYYEGAEGPEERYSFFIIPEDDDGIEDLEELQLYCDKEALVWSFTSSDWVNFQFEGQTWIGSRSIAMIDDGILPRGRFRAVLLDKGGEKSEKPFIFDAPEAPRYPFPFCSISSGVYRIESLYPENYFICYDSQGSYLNSVSLPSALGETNALGFPPETRGVALWSDDPEYSTSALTGIIPVR